MDRDVDVIDASGLYTVEPERFVAARDALARRLRAAGEKAQAAQVAKMRRPTPPAWALNQVARSHPDLIDRLRHTGADLRAATERAVGGDASSLRAARAAQRAAVDSVVDRAADVLERHGRPAAEVTRQRMAATLQATVVDESVAAAVRDGVLTSDHDAPGFGMEALSLPDLGAPSGPPPPTHRPSPAHPLPPSPREKEAQAEAVRQLEAARTNADRLTETADALKAEASRLEEAADRLSSEAQQALVAARAARDRAHAVTQAAAEARAVASRLAGEIG